MIKGAVEIKKENIPKIPAIYYSGVSNLFSKIDPFARKIMARTTLPGGTEIAMTVNLIKDPQNKGKVIFTTTTVSGLIFTFSEAFSLLALTEVIVGGAALALGITATPIVITIVSALGLAVVMTTLGDIIYNVIYDGLEWIEEEYQKSLPVDIYTLHARGEVTKDELNLVLDLYEKEKNTISCLDGFKELKGLRPILNIENKSLATFIKSDTINNKASIQIKDLDEAHNVVNEILNFDNKNKLKKYDITIKTTCDNEEYRIIKKELLEHIAKENDTTVDEIMNYKENDWVKKENRYR